jgi:hypothetical protein
VTKRIGVALLLLIAAACGGKTPSPKASATPAPSRPPVAPGQSNRPLAGSYTYTLSSTKGPAVPQGMQRLETVTISGDRYTSVIGDNENANHVTFVRVWSSTGLTLVSSDAVAGTNERKCAYNPPIRLIPLPLKVEKLPRQTWSSPDLACSGTTDINVIGQETTTDGQGKSWSTWKIEEVTNSGGTSTQTHWFSPDLGVDIRDQSASSAQTTLSVLRDHP